MRRAVSAVICLAAFLQPAARAVADHCLPEHEAATERIIELSKLFEAPSKAERCNAAREIVAIWEEDVARSKRMDCYHGKDRTTIADIQADARDGLKAARSRASEVCK